MSLRIESVLLEDFRGYSTFALEGVGHLVVLVGPNAVGKTNIVEGIQLLTSGESFRKPNWREVVSWGRQRSRLHGTFRDGQRMVEHAVSIEDGRRSYLVNGKRKSIAGVKGTCPSVLFTPDDLQLVKSSSARRRSCVDSLGTQLSAGYAKMRTDYQQVLRQRNQLAADGMMGSALFESWNDSLVSHAAHLYLARRRLFARLARHTARLYGQLVSGERLDAAYVPCWERFDAEGRQISDIGSTAELTDGQLSWDEGAEDAAGVSERLEELVARLATQEQRRQTTLVGPHKDDIAFFVNGRNARLYASQGQQRTIVLAWKLAEVNVVNDILGERPVLLLDDVMSELDEAHRDSLTECMGMSTQTFVTTTNLGYFSESMIEGAQVVHLPLPDTKYAYDTAL